MTCSNNSNLILVESCFFLITSKRKLHYLKHIKILLDRYSINNKRSYSALIQIGCNRSLFYKEQTLNTHCLISRKVFLKNFCETEVFWKCHIKYIHLEFIYSYQLSLCTKKSIVVHLSIRSPCCPLQIF